MPGRWSISLFLLLSACASVSSGAAAEGKAGWTRDPKRAPWFESGLSPTAYWIQFALHEDVREIGTDRCPFRLATCEDANVEREGPALDVEAVSCRAVGPVEERCRFDLFERLADGRKARSRCVAWFEIVGHSHMPSRWGVEQDDYDRPRMRCRAAGALPPRPGSLNEPRGPGAGRLKDRLRAVTCFARPARTRARPGSRGRRWRRRP